MSEQSASAPANRTTKPTTAQREKRQQPQTRGWRRLLPSRQPTEEASSVDSVEDYKNDGRIEKWSLGILNDKKTEEVPGQRTVL